MTGRMRLAEGKNRSSSRSPSTLSTIDAADLVVSAAPFLQLTIAETEKLILASELSRSSGHNAAILGARWRLPLGSPEQAAALNPSRIGLRQFLTQQEGSGYWDHFRPLPHVILSIMDASYRRTTWCDTHGEGVFKLRLLLSGRVLDADRGTLLEGPGALLSLCPRGMDTGYYLAPGCNTRQVVLSCHAHSLTDTLGLGVEEIPLVLRGLASDESGTARSIRLDMNPKVFQAAMDVITSRYEYSGSIRANFLEAKCREILCTVLGELRHRDIERWTGTRLSSRDLNRVVEARDYLANHFRDPPSIPVLARRVGISQTKLKTRFRQVFGMTVHDFVQQQRMRHASDLLLSGEHYIAEVAYAVGYDHPSNFTSAFRKFYGFQPRALKPKIGP